MTDRITDGDRAKIALDHLDTAFMVVEADYLHRMTEIAAATPWEAAKISKLASAIKITRVVRSQIEAIVNDGKLARADAARSAQIESIPAEKRRWLGI